MRQYSAAIYANENLLLSEVLERIENDLPTFGINVYGSSLAGTMVTTATDEYHVNSAESFGDEEILIVLSDPKADVDAIRKFDGSVIDLTGSFEGLMDEVFTIEDPVTYILKALDADVAAAVATVPASVFGKSGIDDLLNQTRELFAFSNAETKVFDERLAFNMFFSDGKDSLLAGYREKLKQDTGVDVDVRMIAVSTGFVLDVYFKKEVKSNFTFAKASEESFSTLSDVIGADGLVLISATETRATFAGDYIHTIVRQVTDALKDITGEDE